VRAGYRCSSSADPFMIPLSSPRSSGLRKRTAAPPAVACVPVSRPGLCGARRRVVTAARRICSAGSLWWFHSRLMAYVPLLLITHPQILESARKELKRVDHGEPPQPLLKTRDMRKRIQLTPCFAVRSHKTLWHSARSRWRRSTANALNRRPLNSCRLTKEPLRIGEAIRRVGCGTIDRF
jgi:hypothetical protein